MIRSAAALPLLLLTCACATTPGGDRVAQRDPLEPFNRGVYTFNRGLDKAVLRPGAQAYRFTVPQSGRRGLSNVYSNVTEPLTFVNALLQAKPKVALRALGRFVVNTVLGVGGLADHATGMGLQQQREDFGQTFAVWGIGSGPYLMLPLLGPSTLRDAVGTGAEFAGGNPMQQVLNQANRSFLFNLGVAGARVLDARARAIDAGADAFLDTSADEYAAVRSAYLQSRRADIFDGNPPDLDGLDDAQPEPAVEPATDTVPEPAVEPAVEPAAAAPAAPSDAVRLPATPSTPPGGADIAADPPGPDLPAPPQ